MATIIKLQPESDAPELGAIPSEIANQTNIGIQISPFVFTHARPGMFGYDRDLTIRTQLRVEELLKDCNFRTFHVRHDLPMTEVYSRIEKYLPDIYIEFKAIKLSPTNLREYGDRVVIRKSRFDQTPLTQYLMTSLSTLALDPLITTHSRQDLYYLVKCGVIPVTIVLGSYHTSADIVLLNKRRKRIAYGVANALYRYYYPYKDVPASLTFKGAIHAIGKEC